MNLAEISNLVSMDSHSSWKLRTFGYSSKGDSIYYLLNHDGEYYLVEIMGINDKELIDWFNTDLLLSLEKGQTDSFLGEYQCDPVSFFHTKEMIWRDFSNDD